MNCNVDVLCKMIFHNKFGFILETVFSYNITEANKLERLSLARLSSLMECNTLGCSARLYDM